MLGDVLGEILSGIIGDVRVARASRIIHSSPSSCAVAHCPGASRPATLICRFGFTTSQWGHASRRGTCAASRASTSGKEVNGSPWRDRKS
jgi:hypothetical protein